MSFRYTFIRYCAYCIDMMMLKTQLHSQCLNLPSFFFFAFLFKNEKTTIEFIAFVFSCGIGFLFSSPRMKCITQAKFGINLLIQLIFISLNIKQAERISATAREWQKKTSNQFIVLQLSIQGVVYTIIQILVMQTNVVNQLKCCQKFSIQNLIEIANVVTKLTVDDDVECRKRMRTKAVK